MRSPADRRRVPSAVLPCPPSTALPSARRALELARGLLDELRRAVSGGLAAEADVLPGGLQQPGQLRVALRGHWRGGTGLGGDLLVVGEDGLQLGVEVRRDRVADLLVRRQAALGAEDGPRLRVADEEVDD